MRLVALVAFLAIVPTARAARPDPSRTGPFSVGVATRTFVDTARARTLVTDVWYPARSSGRDAKPLRGRHPLVLLAHGFCGFRTNYEFLTVAIAAWGFVVAAPDFPGFNQTDCRNHVPLGDLVGDPPRDLSFLRTALRDRTGPAAALARAVGGRRAGVVGHSLGGAVVVHAALLDPRFTAVVALAPLTRASDGEKFVGLHPARAVLVMGGSADFVLPFDAFAADFFGPLPPPAFLLKIGGGTHSGFTDEESLLTAAQLARQQDLTRRYTVAFLKRYLAGARPFAGVLTAADASAQGPDAELSVKR